MSFFSQVKELFIGFDPRTKGIGFVQGAKIGYKWGMQGNLTLGMMGGAYAAATAPRGQAVSRGVAATTSWGITAIAAGTIGTMLGGPYAGRIASVLVPLLGGEAVDKAIVGAVQPMVDFGSNMRRSRFGGDYRDTQTAITMRQVATREMSRSLMNARQWLGQEGAFMHQ